jgi:hypothetical protein
MMTALAAVHIAEYNDENFATVACIISLSSFLRLRKRVTPTLHHYENGGQLVNGRKVVLHNQDIADGTLLY